MTIWTAFGLSLLDSGSHAWPRDARQHLESCERCSQLQALLDSSSQIDFPEALQGRIEAAILPGLRPVSPLPSALRVAVTLLLCSIVVIAAANWRLGIAGWHARSTVQLSVDLSLLGIGALVLRQPPGASDFARIPSRSRCLALPRDSGNCVALGRSLTVRRSRGCRTSCAFHFRAGKSVSPVPPFSAPLFWLALRRGFSLEPVSHGATAGLLAGLVGVTVLEIYCPYLDRFHISAAHIGAAITSTLAGAALGGIQSRIRRRS